MKEIHQLLIILFISQYVKGQTLPLSNSALKNNWERVYIKDVGNIDIPSTMEVQTGNMKTFIDEQRNIIGYDGTQITIQQAGLNDRNPESFNKYARVMLDTYFGKNGDYEKLNFNITLLSESEINQTNIEMKSQMIQSLSGTDIKIIEWYGTSLEKVNGMSCIHFSYKRQSSSNPFVLVHMYYFQNYDRTYRLTMSYRLNDEIFWKSDFADILNSFRIINIK